MPGPYKCPKGGSHQWKTVKPSQGASYKECAKCGQKRP